MNNGTFAGVNATQNPNAVKYWEFTTSGTWQKPKNCTRIKLWIAGGGGGGGRGSTNAGAAGASAGTVTEVVLHPKDLPNDLVTIIVGDGGMGGITSGASGTNGGYSAVFGVSATITGAPIANLYGFYAIGGNGSPALAIAPAQAGRADDWVNHNNPLAGSGSSTSSAPATQSATCLAPTSGGGGGSGSVSNGQGPGGASNASLLGGGIPIPQAPGGAIATNGGHGFSAANYLSKAIGIGIGGGGGGGSTTASPAGNGGNGGFPGGGGGGGGGFGGTSPSSGNGGNGASGVVRIWAW